jgi:hypothetical protein
VIPDPADSTYDLELHGAVVGGKPMWVHVGSTKGAFGAGMAYAPLFNHAVHDVDASALKLAGGKLSGTLEATILPDPYVPRDRKPIACTYTIDAAVRDGGLSGSFTGKCGGEAVAGVVGGRLAARQNLGDSFQVSMKMEQGVAGRGAPWHKRTYLGVTVKGGKAVEGSISNNKGGFTGAFREADLKLDGDALAGTIACDVTSGRVETGTYVFSVKAKVIGDQLTGTFESRLKGKVVKSGRFMGRIQPAE